MLPYVWLGIFARGIQSTVACCLQVCTVRLGGRVRMNRRCAKVGSWSVGQLYTSKVEPDKMYSAYRRAQISQAHPTYALSLPPRTPVDSARPCFVCRVRNPAAGGTYICTRRSTGQQGVGLSTPRLGSKVRQE
jgi:hypothetical protein